MWSNYKGEFTYYISFVLFLRLVMTHLIKLPTLLEIKFKRYILVVNIWIDWCWSSISGLSYNITRNYEVVMVESALVGRWVLILMRVGECDHESTICVSQKFFWNLCHLNTLGWLFTQDLIQTTVFYARELISWNKCPSTVSFWPSRCCSLK